MKGYIILLHFVLVVSFASSQSLVSQQEQERKFNSAVELLNKDQYGASRQLFTEYINQSQANDLKRLYAEYYKAFCSLNLYHGDAEKQIQDFVERNPQHPKAITAGYDLANFYYNEKNFKKAGTLYAKVDFEALNQEQQYTGRFRWGYSLFSQKLLKESLEQFNKIKTSGGTYGPAASYYAGFVEYSQEEYATALTDLLRAESNESYGKVVPYLIANVYYRQKNYDELIKYSGTVSTKSNINNQEEIALLAAEAYYKKADYKKALEGYNLYLDGKEDNADRGVLLRAGYSAFATKVDNQAITYLKNAADKADSVGFYSSYYLGILYLRLNQKQPASVAFDFARKYATDKTLVEECSFQFAKISYDLGRADLAINEFEKILTTFPKSTYTDQIKELLSQAYVNASNYNKAIAYIESLPKRSQAVDKAYQKATMLKGMELFNKDDYPAAVEYLEKSIATPIDAQYIIEASFWNAEAYSIGKKYDKAIEFYSKVINSSGAQPDMLIKARYGLGYCYFNLKQYDKALSNFKDFVSKASKNESNFYDGTLRLADCFYVSKSYPDALLNYRKVAQFAREDADYAHMQAGIILGIQRNYQEASSELDLVIKNYTNSRFYDEALFQKAQLDFEQGNYAQAVIGYSALIKDNPSSKFAPYAYTRRAASYFNLKEYNNTAQDYITVIENYGNHPASNDILLPLQEALNLAGRSGEFDNYLTKIKSAHPDAKGLESVEFEASKSLYFNQEYQKAINALSNFVRNYPESSRKDEVKYYQAESHYRLKQMDKALALYEELSMDKSFLFANKVIGRLAEIHFKLTQYDKALPYFNLLAKLASNKKDQYSAWSGLMESHYLLANYDSSAHYAAIILDKGAVNAGAQNKASLYLGKSSMGKGDYTTAQDEFLNTLNIARDEFGAEAKYLLAEIQSLTKNYKQSNETLFSLNKDFSAYPDWVGKSFLLLADNYLAMGDIFQARGTLNSLIENFPTEGIKNIARERLKKIELETVNKKEPIEQDSVDNQQ